jgi:hypothetical protein
MVARVASVSFAIRTLRTHGKRLVSCFFMARCHAQLFANLTCWCCGCAERLNGLEIEGRLIEVRLDKRE